MALQSRINEIYPNRKPFMEPFDGKRKTANKDLRVQTLLAQEAAKRQCIDGVVPQEQQPPAQEFLQQENDVNKAAPTDFSGFYHQLQQEKQQNGHVASMLQQPAAQQQPDQHRSIDETVPQHYEESNIGLCRYEQQQQQQQQQQEMQQEQPCRSRDGFKAPAHDPHQQLQQHHSQQQEQHSTVSTLEQLLHEHDLNSRHKPPDRELKQLKSLDRVFGADTSRDGFIRDGTTSAAAGAAGGACTRSNSSAAATAAAAAAAAAAREQQTWHLTGLPHIPWDWSVKSSVRLSSAQPFNVLEDGLQEGGLGGWCQAVAAAGGAAPAAAAASQQERLQQALLQWQHPAYTLPPALLAAQHSSTTGNSAAAAAAGAPAAGTGAAAAGGAAVSADRRSDPTVLLLRERVQQWREALRAAYLLLRHGHCPVIYVCGQAFKQPFTAVLCGPGVTGPSSSSSHSCTALLSRSNRQLRAHLAAYGCEGLVAGQLEQQHTAAADQQQGNRKQQQQQQQLSAGAFDGQPGSQLLLLGALQVHSLYAALLALPWCEPGQPDVPLLCAPVHFLHAQLCQLRLVALPDALLDQQQRQAAADAADAAAGHQPLHYVELRTCSSSSSSSIMPWTLHRLLQLVKDSQGLEGFQAYLTTEPCSSSLNVLPELWAAAAVAAGADGSSAAGAAGGQDAPQQQQQQEWQRCGRGFSAAEASSWGSSAGLLHGRVLRQLRVEDGSIAAKLA